MSEWWSKAMPFLTLEVATDWARAALLVVLGLILGRILSSLIRRVADGRLELQQAVLLRRGLYYLVVGLFLTAALHQLGFNLGVLLGAAGVLTVALGFAAQTSAANLVSGLFLIAERPFALGDVIQVGGTSGEVLSIDLLSVKLRTFDNLFVRLPNETVIRSEVRTLTRFPIRRMDIHIGIAYHEDVERVRELLFELADRNPLCLDEPKPLFQVKGFGESSIDLQFSPWALRENYLDVKNGMQSQIKSAFDEEGIEIPFPQHSLQPASAAEPFTVRVLDERHG